MPDPAGAGTSLSETCAPECSPMPLNDSGDSMVCSNWSSGLRRWLRGYHCTEYTGYQPDKCVIFATVGL